MSFHGLDRLRSDGIARTIARSFSLPWTTLALIALVPLYHLVGALVSGRKLFVPEVALDRSLPLRPEWLPVYVSLYVFAFLPVFVVRDPGLRRRAVMAYLTAVVVSYLGFLVFPTVGPRPAGPIGDGFLPWSLTLIYGCDTPYNCFPSLHVAYSFLAALTCYRLHRGVGITAVVWAVLIAISTLYTKQHYLADVVAGAAIAALAYAAFLRDHPRDAASEAERRLAPRRALPAVGAFGMMLVAFWVTYRFEGPPAVAGPRRAAIGVAPSVGSPATGAIAANPSAGRVSSGGHGIRRNHGGEQDEGHGGERGALPRRDHGRGPAEGLRSPLEAHVQGHEATREDVGNEHRRVR